MGQNCVVDVNGCIICPYIPYIPPRPNQIISSFQAGWNAGANSHIELDGGLHVVFQLPKGVTGAYVGLRTGRDTPFLPTLIEHAFVFINTAGVDSYAAAEFGATVTSSVVRAPTDKFEIRRIGALIEYRVNDAIFHTSDQPSVGPKVTTGCLYSTGDEIE